MSVSSNIMRTLVEREWVRVVGHRDVPGKPGIYATTRVFLDYFGLKRLDELPSLTEIRDFDMINKELDFGKYDIIENENENKQNISDQTDAELPAQEQQTEISIADSHSETISLNVDKSTDPAEENH